MLVATWNVNSLRARLPRVLEFLRTHRPDALCLQETKTTAEAFPHAELADAGYVAAERSSGQWTGVAILAPAAAPPVEVVRELPGEPFPDEARWVEATVRGVRIASVYVVNGRALDDPMFRAKLSMLEAIGARVRALAGGPLIVTGDFNIAPADRDVYDPAAFAGATHVSPPERAALGAILDGGLLDAFRVVEPAAVQHTWWDYRGGAFHRGHGLRIDLALVSADLAPHLRACGIDREFRKGPKPSDHAPLLLEIDDGAPTGA